MPRYEYKVLPAPTKGRRGKGVRGNEAKFSFAIEELMNEMAADGWEYQRAETLPSTERAGIGNTTTEWRNLLVFRRISAEDAEAFQPELLPAPAPHAPPDIILAAAPVAPNAIQSLKDVMGGSAPLPDNGVEDLTDQSEAERPGPALSILAKRRSIVKTED